MHGSFSATVIALLPLLLGVIGGGCGGGDSGAGRLGGGVVDNDSTGANPAGPSATNSSTAASGSMASSGGAGGMSVLASSTTTTMSASVSSSSSSGQGGTFEVAPHPGPPQILNEGGPIITSPKIVPVYFSNDDPSITAGVTTFIGELGKSAYWASVGKEYGVGPTTTLPAIQLAETATGTWTQDTLQTWLVEKIESDPTFPPADDETIYTLIFPAGVTLELSGTESCVVFGGYHESTNLDATHGNQAVVYAAIPRCESQAGLGQGDELSAALSHEFIEASTDPIYDTNQAWGRVDDTDVYWEYIFGSEVGDLCALSPSPYTNDPAIDYTVQRIWSNTSAAAGHDPCVPIPDGEVYFNSVPVLTDDISIPDVGTPIAKGVTIPVGQSKTIELDLFSEAPTDGPWTITAYDGDQIAGNQPSLSFSVSPSSGQNGDKVSLTIQVLKQGTYGFETFVLYSELDGQGSLSAGLVGN